MYSVSFIVWGGEFIVICGMIIFDEDGIYLGYF